MGTDWSALGNLTTGLMPLVAKPGSGAAQYAGAQNQAFQESQIQEALKRQQAQQKKKEKSALFGSLGGTLGAIGGAALAPLTGGASLLIPAALGAAGGAIGSTAGQALGGGGINPQQSLMAGAMGGIGGYMGGSDAGFGAKTLDNPGTYDPTTGAFANGIHYTAPKITSGAMAKSTFGSMFGGMAPIPGGGGSMRRPRMSGYWQAHPTMPDTHTWSPYDTVGDGGGY